MLFECLLSLSPYPPHLPCPRIVKPSLYIEVMLMLLVQSMIRRLPNSLCPTGSIHHRTHGCKWSSLKVRKGKYKGEHGRVQVLLKLMLIYGKGGTRWVPSNNQQVGRDMGGSQPGEGGLGCPWASQMWATYIWILLLAFLSNEFKVFSSCTKYLKKIISVYLSKTVSWFYYQL
jgi:hypothetical protein